MKTWMGVLIVIAAIVGPPLGVTVLAQTGGSSSITITQVAVNPYPGGGVIVTSGNYSVATGYSFTNITNYVMPTGGAAGQGGEVVAAYANQGNFGGGGIAVPSGTYDVQAVLTVTDSSGTPYYFYSDTKTGITVP